MGRKKQFRGKKPESTLEESKTPSSPKKPTEDGAEPVNSAYGHTMFYTNTYMENFYKHQLASDFSDETEFQFFMDTIKQNLPISFRINPTYPNWESFVSQLNDDKFMKENFFNDEECMKEHTEGESGEVCLRKPDWYPDGLVYELNVSRRTLKKAEGLKRLHKWIQKAGDCGILTRQELVSMLPPIALEPKMDDVIFDMCAAPGSKTSQLLETIYHDFHKNYPEGEKSDVFIKGGVICNDMDSKR
jgi:16S rRNA C967 or C1407 C5-methylase (RsmB/RsmF family)